MDPVCSQAREDKPLVHAHQGLYYQEEEEEKNGDHPHTILPE
jgi:hypothetical protein